MACSAAPRLHNPLYKPTPNLIGDEYVGWVSCGGDFEIIGNFSTCQIEPQSPGKFHTSTLDVPADEYIGWVDSTPEQRDNTAVKPSCECTCGRHPEHGHIVVYQDELISEEEKLNQATDKWE
ncbi:hypothetical protein B0A52_07191 [Exophiala mesophila]|uniref:Uncharacterized protein n=1 Tax=Exophiala mesophila TaxID=212818 RepID=A0A438N0G8_EXOME|nr:hypothetical protein B0A52_07191 [Exophiala mesophila]